MVRALLVSLRDPDDPMALHEHQCFADCAGIPVDSLHRHPMANGTPSDGQLREYNAIFFGGSGAYSVLDDVDWIQAGIRLCLRVAELQIPAYASCFGFQGLAVALGGKVIRDPARTELGATWLECTAAASDDMLFRHLPKRFSAQEGHHDHVVELPRDVTLLATGEVSTNQAFRVNGAPFWASQFHPELTAQTSGARFRHYLSHYSDDPGSAMETLQRIEAGFDTPEVAQLLHRVVRLPR